MAQTPDVCRQRFYLVRRELRPTHGRHRAAILLRVRHTFRYRFQNSGKAAIAPQPFLAAEIRTQGRARAVRAMASRAGRSAHLTVVDTITQRNHLWRHAFGKGSACVWMRSLRRFGGGCDDIAGRSRRTGAWSDRARHRRSRPDRRFGRSVRARRQKRRAPHRVRLRGPRDDARRPPESLPRPQNHRRRFRNCRMHGRQRAG